MSTCTWIKKIETFVDGELTDVQSVEAHMMQCAECARYRDELLRVRTALEVVSAQSPQVSDDQFRSFMDGIHDGVDNRSRHPRGFWALLSLTAAALVIAIATFSVFTGPGPVKANEVESVSTQLDNATVHWDNSDDGVTTIWISISEDDV